MSRLAPLLRRLGPVGLVAGALLVAPPARGEDGPPSPAPPAVAAADPVASLRPEEIEAVRRQVPEWDTLEAAKRTRIATVVLRLRAVSPDVRARVLERLQTADRAGPVAMAELFEKLERYRTLPAPDRERQVRAHVAARAITAAVLSDLGPEAIGSFFDGLTFSERAQVATAIGLRWKRHVGDALVAAPDLGAEPSAAADEGARRDFLALRDQVRAAGGAAAPEKLRRAFAQRLLEMALLEWKQATPQIASDAERVDVHWVVFGHRMRDRWPVPYEQTLADARAARAQGREGIRKLVEAGQGGGGERPATRQRVLWELVGELEKKRSAIEGGLRDKLDAFERDVLRELKVPDEDVRRLQATVGTIERFRVLRDLLQRFGPLGANPLGRVPGRPFRHGPPPTPPTTPPAMDDDDGGMGAK